VALITPFNFPLEIPALQLMGALYMGNKPLLHCDHRVRGQGVLKRIGLALTTWNAYRGGQLDLQDKTPR
jgi:hypothetical protein